MGVGGYGRYPLFVRARHVQRCVEKMSSLWMCYTQICPRFGCRDEHTIHTCVYCVLWQVVAGTGKRVLISRLDGAWDVFNQELKQKDWWVNSSQGPFIFSLGLVLKCGWRTDSFAFLNCKFVSQCFTNIFIGSEKDLVWLSVVWLVSQGLWHISSPKLYNQSLLIFISNRKFLV